MFGHGYFGSGYFGPRYFGPLGAPSVAVPLTGIKPVKQLVQEAAEMLTLPLPNPVFGGVDANSPILRRLINRAGEHMMRRHNWQALIVQHVWTAPGFGLEAQPGAMPADYDRFAYNPLVWDVAGNRPLMGPTDSRMWTALKNGALVPSVVPYWRIINGVLNIFPAPEAGRVYGMEYISKYWAAGSDGTPKAEFSNDSDVPRLPDYLFVDELVWRWKQAKGFDYAEDMRTSEYAIERACSQDRATGIVMPYPSIDQVRDVMASTWPGVIVP